MSFFKPDPTQCKERVHDGGGRVTFHQCTRKAGPSGYCKQHSPEAVEARRARQGEKYKAHWAKLERDVLAKEIGTIVLSWYETSLQTGGDILDESPKNDSRTILERYIYYHSHACFPFSSVSCSNQGESS